MCAAIAVLMLGLLVSVSDANHATTELVSIGAAGGDGPFTPTFGGASADGARVFFATDEALDAGDTDSRIDLYERFGSTTTRVSTGPSGGNGAFDATFEGSSADGTRVFFTTNESLDAGDTDTFPDIYERSGSTTTRITTGPSGGNGNFYVFFRGASADGTRVFFTTNESLEPGDTDTRTDVYERSGSTTTRISTGSSGGNGTSTASFSDASADGTRVFFTSYEALEPDDTDSQVDIYERSGSTTTRISTGSSGGNAAFGAGFGGSSADGTRVFFDTNESLDAGDTDTRTDVYERSGSTTARISTSSTGGNGSFDAFFRGASADGTRVFFGTQERLEAGDTDPHGDIYERFGSTTTRITTGSSGGNGNFSYFFRTPSADGTRFFFVATESLEPDDTDTKNDIYERSGSTTTRISTGSSGGNGSFGADFAAVSADGTRVFFATAEPLEPDDTDTATDIYERFGSTTTRISTGPSGGNDGSFTSFDGMSADGTRVFFNTDERLLAADGDSANDIYAAGLADTSGYPRPQGATPIRVSLVPAYKECTSPNVGHAAPFAFEACNPPELVLGPAHGRHARRQRRARQVDRLRRGEGARGCARRPG